MPHSVFGLPFWTVAFVFVAIWTGLDLVSKERYAVRRTVGSAQSIAITISIIFFSMQILEWINFI